MRGALKSVQQAKSHIYNKNFKLFRNGIQKDKIVHIHQKLKFGVVCNSSQVQHKWSAIVRRQQSCKTSCDLNVLVLTVDRCLTASVESCNLLFCVVMFGLNDCVR